MRKDREFLVADSLEDDFGNGVRLEGALGQKVETQLPFSGEHVGLDPLRTQARNPDALTAMCDRQPLEQRKGGCLGDSVGGGEDVVEKPGGGDGTEEITLPSLQHCGQRGAPGEDLAHQADLPEALPLISPPIHSASTL